MEKAWKSPKLSPLSNMQVPCKKEVRATAELHTSVSSPANKIKIAVSTHDKEYRLYEISTKKATKATTLGSGS